MPGNEIPSATRSAVINRDFNRCVRCSGVGTEIQHRMRRREGGHAMSNLIRVCHTCHRWMHENPREAHEQGFIVKTWEQPNAVPLKTWRGWMLLDDGGGIALADAPT